MKLLAITALFIAGTLAVPASNSYPPPPPPGYGDGYKGDVGYGGDYGGDHGGYYPGDPKGDGDGYGYVPPPPPPPPGYDDGGSDEPPTDGDGYPSDGWADGGDSDGGSDGGYRERSNSGLCPPGLYSVPQCCSTSVLNLAAVDCDTPKTKPNNVRDFNKICAANGDKAVCCVLPILGLGVLCTDVPRQ